MGAPDGLSASGPWTHIVDDVQQWYVKKNNVYKQVNLLDGERKNDECISKLLLTIGAGMSGEGGWMIKKKQRGARASMMMRVRVRASTINETVYRSQLDTTHHCPLFLN